MKKIQILLLSILVTVICITTNAQTLTLKWKTDTLLRVPESVLVDSKNNVLYVANIDGAPDGKDGKGFISKVSPQGKIVNLEWVTGLDAPKGMGLFNNTLYVADLTRVAVIDIKSGKITSSIDIPGSSFLNDVTVDEKGNVYVSDSNTGKVHKITNNKPEVFFESADVKSTNGVLALKDALYLIDFQSGTFYKVDWNKKLTKIGVAPSGGDGVVTLGKNEFIVSSWYGEISLIDANGKVTKLLDTKEQKLSSADIDFDAKTKTIYVPTFFRNSVMAYELKK
jgi:DNA-binding beta-propeller fold protein YncE